MSSVAMFHQLGSSVG